MDGPALLLDVDLPAELRVLQQQPLVLRGQALEAAALAQASDDDQAGESERLGRAQKPPGPIVGQQALPDSRP